MAHGQTPWAKRPSPPRINAPLYNVLVDLCFSGTFLKAKKSSGITLTACIVLIQLSFLGDAVNLVVEKSPSYCGAKWSAKQILITDESRSELNQLLLNVDKK